MTVRVRDAVAEDAGPIADIYAPYVADSVVSFEGVPPDGGEILSRMQAPPRLPWLVADDDGQVVGYTYAVQHRQRDAYRWSVDCSVYLRAGERGRGIGRLLYDALLPLLGDLGYHRAYAGIALPNPASVALHEAMGFVRIGVYEQVGYKQGAWHDVGWWQLPLTASGTPQEPKHWHPNKAT